MKYFTASSTKTLVLTVLILLAIGLNATASELMAGASKLSLGAPHGISLAGYGGGKRRHFSLKRQNKYAHYLKASHGTLDDVFAKTLFLKNGSESVVIIGLDLIASTRDLRKDLAKRLLSLGILERNIILTATHTHSGPGCVSKSKFWQLIAADKFVKDVYSTFLDAITESVFLAYDEMVPARLGIGSFELNGFTRNRRNQPDLDPVATLIRVDDLKGDPIGTILNFPIHGTALGISNLKMSSDIPGAMANALEEKTGGVVVFVNGAEGDVSPIIDGAGYEGILNTAAKAADVIYPEWSAIPLKDTAKIKIVEKDVKIGRAKFNIEACLNKDIKGIKAFLPLAVFRLPRVAVMNILSVNDHAFVSIPGEPTTRLGVTLKNLGRDYGFKSTSIFGLSNDHLGYILTQEEFKKGGYEACGSLYGQGLSGKIINGVKELFSEFGYP